MTRYSAQPHELDAVWAGLVGDRNPEDNTAWYMHLSSRQAVLDLVIERIADDRASAAADIYDQMGPSRSYRRLADLLNISRGRAQQLVERSRRAEHTTTRG